MLRGIAQVRFAISQSLGSFRNPAFEFRVERANFGLGRAALGILQIHFSRVQPHQEAKNHYARRAVNGQTKLASVQSRAKAVQANPAQDKRDK